VWMCARRLLLRHAKKRQMDAHKTEPQ
jgi:hypothetical protein